MKKSKLRKLVSKIDLMLFFLVVGHYISSIKTMGN